MIQKNNQEIITLVIAGIYAVASIRDRYLLALATVAGLSFGLVAVVGRLIYPMIDRVAGLTVEAAIVSTISLNLMVIGGPSFSRSFSSISESSIRCSVDRSNQARRTDHFGGMNSVGIRFELIQHSDHMIE